MLLDITSDQDFLQETTRKYIEAECAVATIRALRHDSAGFDPEYWRRGAELGWTSLLVAEADGGGSVSGSGLLDLTLIAHEFGRHAAPGPLLSCGVVAGALSRWGTAEHKESVLPGLMAGTTVASWAHAEPPPHHRLGEVRLEAARRGGDVVLNGTKGPVEAGAQAAYLLVSGLLEGRLTQFLVPATAAGLSIHPLQSLDLTRRFARVTFDDVVVPASAAVGTPGGAAPQIEELLRLGLAIQLAETAGAMDAAFTMALEWAFSRYTFGRPLASYQELKHRFADMKTWLEASHAIAGRVALAVQDGDDDAGELASIGKSYIGSYGPELAQDCVQMHGGIGVTFDHDLHLFLRRITVNRALLGTPTEHRDRLVGVLESHLGDPGEAIR
ncbi:MAG TPA: acyl-CoA dehydrogenase family protein [Acidimicrobiales bacterium]|jgi:alkylation response protein AidB-like acyl-CoA dehydrogenase